MAEATTTLATSARERKMIPHSDFIRQIRSISFDGPHDPRLRPFLGEISSAESLALRRDIARITQKTMEQQSGGKVLP
jgi:hypothetical protein